MTECYPVILEYCGDGSGYLAYSPDFDARTQGKDIPEAIFMARDLINLCGVVHEDDGKPVPPPSDINSLKCGPKDIKTLVDVDFAAYRRMLENKSVKKNCTIPSWLNDRAERAGINFSATLQSALKEKLGIE